MAPTHSPSSSSSVAESWTPSPATSHSPINDKARSRASSSSSNSSSGSSLAHLKPVHQRAHHHLTTLFDAIPAVVQTTQTTQTTHRAATPPCTLTAFPADPNHTLAFLFGNTNIQEDVWVAFGNTRDLRMQPLSVRLEWNRKAGRHHLCIDYARAGERRERREGATSDMLATMPLGTLPTTLDLRSVMPERLKREARVPKPHRVSPQAIRLWNIKPSAPDDVELYFTSTTPRLACWMVALQYVYAFAGRA